MPKTITLRLDEEVYRTFHSLAERDNRPLSNFIETAAMRYVMEQSVTDPYETAKILGNTPLKTSLKRGHKDVQTRRGGFV